LIDSGSDSRGSMIDVATHVRRKCGAVDFSLSNLRPFRIASPLYINGGLNWLTLSPDQIGAFGAMKEHCIITLGPAGVADICNLVDARYYLPYAHWFGELGRSGDVAADTPGHSEMSLLAWLGDALRQRSASTEIIPWQIGDGFVLHPGRGFETSSLTS
jgi:hypothetical protein